MKKIFLLLLTIFIANVSANAIKRSKSQMLSAASQVLNNRMKMSASMPSDVKLEILDQTYSQITIVGYKDGAFVLVANDDSMPAVVGYSNSNAKFNLETAAPAFKWYLELANRNLEDRVRSGKPAPRLTINPEYKPEVPQLCQTEWGQDEPYWRQTPVYDGYKHYYTGCVATAMAQVMKYYRYPDYAEGHISYLYYPGSGSRENSMTFGEQPFDWDNMLNIYKNRQYSEANANAVAYLMKAAGAAVKMQYKPTGSGAFTPDAAKALYTNFKYSQSLECYWKDIMHLDEWYDIAYHALSDGCPLVFGAQTQNSEYDAGHSFVVDGYEAEEGYVHVNFGWDGNSDGYYPLLDMNSYNSGFQMIPVRKPAPNLHIKSFMGLWDSNLEYNLQQGKVTANIINGSSRPFSGTIAVMLKNLSDGSEEMLSYVSQENLTTDDGTYLNIVEFKEYAPIPEGMPDGKYRLYMASKGYWEVKDNPADDNEVPHIYEEPYWEPIRSKEGNRNSVLITITNGVPTVTAESNSNWVLGINNVVSENKSSDIVNVYDAQGVKVYTSAASDFRLSDVPAEGLLIIKEGNIARKVIK